MSQTLIALTGTPGTGKTTIAHKLLETGLKALFINDYDIFGLWLERQKANSDLVRFEGESFWFSPKAYTDLSLFTAQKLGQSAQSLFDQGCQVVIVEAARGAGEPMDNYLDHLFVPLRKELSDEISLINIEVECSFQKTLERSKRRFSNDPTSPPPDTLLRYFIDGLPRTSSVAELRGYETDLNLRANQRVNNGENFLINEAVLEIRHVLDQEASIRGEGNYRSRFKERR